MANTRRIARLPFPRRFGRRRRNNGKWTAQLLDGAAITASPTVLSSVLVAVTDYSSNTSMERGEVTVKRIVGNITLTHHDAVATTVWLGIYKANVDEGIAQQDPANFQNSIDEDVMWWYSYRWGNVAGNPHDIPIDIRVKRRLKEDEIRLHASTTNGVSSVFVAFNTRILIGGDIN